MDANIKSDVWLPLPYKEWKNTLGTLHLWMQIVGKVKLKLAPFQNQWWEVAFFVTSRGMTTGPIPYNDIGFEVVFDFIDHTLSIYTSEGKKQSISLKPYTVAAFNQNFMHALSKLGIHVKINTMPSEIPHAIPFEEDITHASYDKEWVERWWRILLTLSFILDRFNEPFRGKHSPVLFYWGSFDLNTTRFSGRKLPDKVHWPKGYNFMRYAENEENIAFGFWPGDEKFPEAAFYSYLYPAHEGMEGVHTGSSIAYYNSDLSECILPYEDVRKVKNPETAILHFLNTTYKEYATLARWDIENFVGKIPPNVF